MRKLLLALGLLAALLSSAPSARACNYGQACVAPSVLFVPQVAVVQPQVLVAQPVVQQTVVAQASVVQPQAVVAQPQAVVAQAQVFQPLAVSYVQPAVVVQPFAVVSPFIVQSSFYGSNGFYGYNHASFVHGSFQHSFVGHGHR